MCILFCQLIIDSCRAPTLGRQILFLAGMGARPTSTRPFCSFWRAWVPALRAPVLFVVFGGHRCPPYEHPRPFCSFWRAWVPALRSCSTIIILCRTIDVIIFQGFPSLLQVSLKTASRFSKLKIISTCFGNPLKWLRTIIFLIY